MNKAKFLYIFSVLLLVSVSCNKDYLDKTPDEDLTLEEVFSQRRYAESFLTSMYFNLPEELSFNDWWGRNPFVGASDEMEITWTYPFAHLMNSGAWNADNVEPNIWNFMFEGIRKANIFLANVEKVPMEESARQVWIGEATFMRAFFHFWLARIYGPVPIVNEAFTADADFAAQIKRAPIDQVISFIASECDKAASLLPMRATSDKYGRATAAAALALKSRALLYMASPSWNGNAEYAGFKNKEGEELFPTSYNQERWKAAADAALDCIEQVESAGYKLYRSADGDPVKSYQELFLNRWNDEVLFARNMGVWDHQERCTSPNGMGGWSGYCPTQELVDSYQMVNGEQPILGYNPDGSPIINEESGYSDAGYATEAHPEGWYPAGIRNMYVGREPRFYASIHYSGAMWRGRPIEFWLTGLDGRGKGGPDYAITGYLMKKFSDPTVNIPQGRFTLKTWIYFRLGEQYLNYAEALNEYQGPVPDVYAYVNLIRERAGLPALPADLNKEEMREKIRHERKIELAFETHRYFDCHRWKIAHIIDNSDIHGLNIGSGTSLQDESFYQRTFIEKRIFVNPKHYLWPIPQSEIDKNVNIVQNPGW